MTDMPATKEGRRFTTPIYWGRAIGAGVVATIIMTIVGVVLKMSFPKMVGSMVVPNASLTVQYMVGGAMHFMIGIVYGIIYVALVGRLVEWNRFIKGAVYGLAITAIAFAAMPVMSAMMGGGGAGNPCESSGKSAGNPCHPQAAMNPCHPQEKSAMNPCHPQGSQAMNPCHPKAGATAPYQQASGSSGQMNPCHSKGGGGNPCNPCGGGGGPWSGVISVANHLVYALALAFVYGKTR